MKTEKTEACRSGCERTKHRLLKDGQAASFINPAASTLDAASRGRASRGRLWPGAWLGEQACLTGG